MRGAQSFFRPVEYGRQTTRTAEAAAGHGATHRLRDNEHDLLRRFLQRRHLRIGLPILLNGTAVGSLNCMYLRGSTEEADAVVRLLHPQQKGAAGIAQALAAIRAGGESSPHAAKFSLSPASGHGMATR